MGASERFDRYMDHLSHGLGHLDRHAGLKATLINPLFLTHSDCVPWVSWIASIAPKIDPAWGAFAQLLIHL